MYKKIGMLGGKNSILPFKGLGIDVFPVTDLEAAKKQLEEMAPDYGVIFITERIVEQLESEIAHYDDHVTPAIIPIPSSSGVLGIGMDRLKKTVEEAIGMAILQDD
ncbi:MULTISPECIES: V-type ATP synthase subunit F [Enterococcus]|nr:V-type ATP synthase subunit F [Enterococcus alcedinis]MBP2102202.1 V/A-type H+-transporting ATPase subunit F [Enterococcus alcedinis]